MSLTGEQMYELATHHAQMELELNFDAVLETMTQDGYYEFYPQRIRVTGRDTLKTMWTQIFIDTPGLTSEDFVSGNPREEWWVSRTHW